MSISQQKSVIYFDHAATTPLDEAVFLAMEPWMREQYGNASASYTLGHHARRAIDEARTTVAHFLQCSSQEIIFTAGGTESTNIAIFGAARAQSALGRDHIVTTTIEHAAVLESCRALRKEGFGLAEVGVPLSGTGEREGVVDVHEVVNAVTAQTGVVSVMMANNEIGTIQPVAGVARAVKENQPELLVHTDACQAAGSLDLNVENLGVDLLTMNASKIYGPKGVGALYVRRGTQLHPLLYGGDQERSLRPGTENVAGIVGFAKAVELAALSRETETARLTALRDRCLTTLEQTIPGIRLNGSRTNRLYNNINVHIPNVDGESLLFSLDEQGIQASLGSACAAGSIEPSHVLLALGLSKEDARNSLRISFGRSTTDADVEVLLRVLPELVQKLQQRS